MWQAIRDGWSSLSGTGKTIVTVVAIVAASVLVWFAMFWRYDVSWIPGIFGQ